ncbi:MAG: ATP-binding protein [Clostridium sp.]
MFQIKVAAKKEQIIPVIEALSVYLHEAGCSEETVYALEVALEELITNIVNYAYPAGCDMAYMEVLCAMEETPEQKRTEQETPERYERVIVTLIDEGIAYNPLEQPEPDIELPLEKRSIGGLGIYMTKHLIDELEYHRRDGKNILILKNKVK